MTWHAPASDGGAAITDYTVTSDPGGKTCTSSGALACTVTGLTNGTPYTFSVTAKNAANLTGPSAASAEVIPATTPSAPTAVTATSPGVAGRVTLQWTAPASGGSAITDYLIQLSIDDGATWSDVVRGPSTGTTATINDLYDTLDYRFRVLAKNAVGYGPASVASDPVAPTNTSGAPGPVTEITTRPIDDAVILSWTAPAYLGASVTKYAIQYKCTRVPGSRQDHCDDTSPLEEWSPWYDTSTNADPKATEAQIGREGINRGNAFDKDGELFDGNKYLFRVRALIGSTEGVWTETTDFTYPQEGCTPNAPTGLEGTTNSTTSIGLSWTRDPGGKPVGNPPVGCLGVEMDPRTHYKLQYQSSDDGTTWTDWSASTDTASMDTTYAFTGLTSSTWYRFRVQEWPDDDNRSAWSPASAAVQTTALKTVPGHPTNVSGDARDASAVITWTAPAGNGGYTIDQYRVTAYTDAAGTVPASGTNPQTLASGGTFTGLTNGDDYYFRVEAHNSVGWSVTSDLSAAVTPRTVPDAPDKPSANPTAGDGTVALSWTEPVSTGGSAITNYLVEYSSDSGTSWSPFGHAATTDPGVVVTGLATGRGYVFRVAAVNEAGAGTWSAVSDSTTPYSVPTAPTSLVGTPEFSLTAGATTTSVGLVWAAPIDNGGSPITGYRVQYSINDGNTWTSQEAAGTSATITGLPVSTVTRLRVRAFTAATRASDNGYEWATTTITTATPPAPAPAPPNPVTGLSAVADNALVALSWTASTTTGAPVTGYSVIWSTDGTHWSSPTTTAATSLAVTELTNGTLYHFKVSPTSSSGLGAPESVDATPAAPTKLAPQAVRSLAAVPGVLVANLAWTEPATSDSYAPVTGYVVQRSTSENSWTTLATLDASKKAYLASGLKGGTTYNFRVFATSAAGDGAIARTVSAVPIATSNYERVAGSAETWTGGSVLMQAGTSLLSKDTLTDVTVTATGSMATSPVGNGYGVWVRASFTNSQISGYCFQVDPGYGNNFILRWWTNGKERGTPWASTKFPAGFDPNAPHVVSVSVLGGVLTGRVDGVTVMTTTLPTQSETVNGITFTPNTGGRYGFRTWYPTIATVKDITVQSY